MNGSLPRSEKGFASTYFLIILLYVSAFTASLMITDRRYAGTMMNLETVNRYLVMENKVIQDIRCHAGEEYIPGEYETDGISYTLDVSGDLLLVSVGGTYPEELVIVFDPETGRLTDYEAVRSVEVSDY